MTKSGKHIGMTAFVLVSITLLIVLVPSTNGQQNENPCPKDLLGRIFASGEAGRCETLFSDDAEVIKACKKAHMAATQKCDEMCRKINSDCVGKLREGDETEGALYRVHCDSAREFKENKDGTFGNPMGTASEQTTCVKFVDCDCVKKTSPSPSPSPVPSPLSLALSSSDNSDDTSLWDQFVNWVLS